MDPCPCCGKPPERCRCKFVAVVEGGLWCKRHDSYWPNGLKVGSSLTDKLPKTEG